MGTVVFECMDGLPRWPLYMNGQRWCEELLNRCSDFYGKSDILPHMTVNEALDLMDFVTDAMLNLEPKARLSARNYLGRV